MRIIIGIVVDHNGEVPIGPEFVFENEEDALNFLNGCLYAQSDDYTYTVEKGVDDGREKDVCKDNY